MISFTSRTLFLLSILSVSQKGMAATIGQLEIDNSTLAVETLWELTIGDQVVPVEHGVASDKRSIQRRAMFPIRCGDGHEVKDKWVFSSSSCVRPGVRDFKCNTYSVDPNEELMFEHLGDSDLWQTQHDTIYGQCPESQICVDGVRHDLAEPKLPYHPVTGEPWEITTDEKQAYCSEIGRKQSSHSRARITEVFKYLLDAPSSFMKAYPRTRGHYGMAANHSSDIVFTSDGGNDALIMQSISITAQSSNVNLATGRSWVDLATKKCTGCNSIGFLDIPEHTSRFLIKPVFPPSINSAVVYMWND